MRPPNDMLFSYLTAPYEAFFFQKSKCRLREFRIKTA